MNAMREVKLKVVRETPELTNYQLPKAIAALFKRFDTMVEYLKKAGKPCPEFVRLSYRDWLDVEHVALQQSNNRFDGNAIRWRGLPVVSDARSAGTAASPAP